MDVRIIVETTTETGEKRKQQIIRFNLPGQCHGDLGLKLEHSKTLLALQKLWAKVCAQFPGDGDDNVRPSFLPYAISSRLELDASLSTYLLFGECSESFEAIGNMVLALMDHNPPHPYTRRDLEEARLKIDFPGLF